MPLGYVHQIMNTIGQIEDGLEFVDLNKDTIETLKPFNSIIERCEELEKSFVKFEAICKEKHILFKNFRNYNLFNTHLERDIAKRDKVTGLDYFDLVESEVFEDEKKIDEHIKISEETKLSYLKLLEEKCIVAKLNSMFNTGEIVKEFPIYIDSEREGDLRYIAGICNSFDEIRIEKITFRMSRGRAIPCFFDIDLNKIKRYTNNNTEKKMFLVLIQGNFLRDKILMMLNIFNCHIYQIPNPEEIQEILEEMERELLAKEKLIFEAERTFIQFLLQKTGNTNAKVSI